MLQSIQATLRAILICAWLGVCCCVWIVVSVARWGNLDNNAFAAHLFSRLALRIGGIRLRVKNAEGLRSRQPCIYVANHQSALDVMTFGSIYPKGSITIGKQELLWIPLFGVGFAAAGNVLIRRSDRRHSLRGLGRAVDAIRSRGASVFIFPEGTRNRALEGLLPFKKGAFHMAIEAGVPIVPVVCSSVRPVLSGNLRHLLGGELTLSVLDPIEPPRSSSEVNLGVETLLSETRTRMLAALAAMNDHSEAQSSR